MDNDQASKQAKLVTYSKSLALVFILHLYICAPHALAQYDFNGDGVDELLHVAQTADGIIQWEALDPVTGENSLLGYFGEAGDQFAVGNWVAAGELGIGVIGHGGESAGDLRFKLDVPLDLANSAKSVLFYLQRGDRASIISSSDLDGNGLSDVAVVRRGHAKRAVWHVTLNPLDSAQFKKRTIVFGSGKEDPFTFYFRGGKESLARLRVPKNKTRAMAIYHCRLPCKRQHRLRVSQDLVDPDNVRVQVLRSSQRSFSNNTRTTQRDSLVFIRETAADQELTFINASGRPERKQSAPKGAAIVVGNFGEADVLEIINNKAQTHNNATGEKIVFTGKVNKPVQADVIQEYPEEKQEGTEPGTLAKLPVAATATPTPSVASATPTPLPTSTVTAIPTFTATPTFAPTYTPTSTPTPTVTMTPTIATPTLTPTNTATPIPELMLGGTSRSVALNQFASTDLNLGILSDLLIPDDSVEFELISAPKFGTLTFKYIYSDSGNQVNYVLQQNFQGVDQFSYRICYKFDASKSYCSVPYIYEIRVDVVKNMLSAYRDQLISVSTTLNDLLSKVRSYPSGSSDEVKVSYRGEVFALVNSLNNNLESYQIGEEEISYTQQVVVDSSPNAYNLANASWADINNDGLLDLFVASEGRTSYLFRQKSDGTFEDITQASGIRDVLGTSALSTISSWSDYNNDGYMDLYVPIKTGMTNKLFRNNGDGTFSLASAGVETSFGWGGTYSFGSSWADYNQDGLMDLSVARWGGGSFPTLLFKNNGDGSFSSINDSAGITAVAGSGAMSYWADLNRDGFIDYLIARPVNTGRVFISDGDGTFTALNMPDDFTNLWGFSLFDVDGDGDVDIRGNGKIWVNDLDPDTKQVVFSSTTDNFEATSTEICGIFNYPTSRTDIDQDGDLDYVTGGWESKTVTINVNESYYGLEAIIGENESLPIKTKCISAHNLELISTNVNEHNLLITFDSDGESRVQKAISIVSNEIASTTELIARLP